ncbi:F-actin-monooxygenase Mical isoform X2 [Ooceraea biroi]|uniref:F-actin-monooxygenase Mical isoform X2 n=1 Tax=Ooceraea biroi TaxID=2015173 RepID=UPI0005BC5EF0|nr:F-actin-monooxygenase Mical isoform X2 [Ooceraea biroi]
MNQQEVYKKQIANTPEIALASEVFDQFCNATTLKSILGYYRQLCELLKIRPNVINQFYPKLKAKLRSWKAQALWKKFDQRASHKCYNRGKACPNTRVLIIGGGPCGLRTAIEAQLLGAKVVVIEKRDRMSRNNVLHLWPFVIQDLRGLGAKKFFGKFCAGSIDHISIRQLQCILLKVALILGVEFHESVSFVSLIQPPSNQEDGKIGWRAKTLPMEHPVCQYEFDVLIGADGKRNTLEGFKRKEFRGKLAIAITANFINKRTEAEARVEEISGVAFIFNQKFFKELYQETGIDLENIVYYKDDTHYFVMTAKKHSLIDKGVILQDHADTAKLLAKENVDREALMLYAREAAEFSTEYQMMDMEFAVNHYGQPDVAMFDFTSMYAAENASRVLERYNHKLLMILVGDSLLEPFWPTGSGCARGFLSSLDAGWAIKAWGAPLSLLEVIAERESIYRLLGQTTPENLNRDYGAYTLDPHTRYPNLNIRCVTPMQVRSLLDTDDPDNVKSTIQSEMDIPKKRKRRDQRTEVQIHPDTLLRWLQKQVALYDKIHIEDMGASFKDGLAICAIIHRYRPDLIDFYSLDVEDVVKNNQLAFDILEKELGILPIMTGKEMAQCDIPDKLLMFSYLAQIYEVFRGEIPCFKHPQLESETEERTTKQVKQLISEDKATKVRHLRLRHANENIQSYMDRKDNIAGRRSRKRRNIEKMSTVEDREPKVRIGYQRGSMDEEFSGRIKNFEDKLKGTSFLEKKPRDLLRAIGKIEKTDWNVKEIEKKIEENKMGRSVRHDSVEKVPKWSREQFLARQIKMEKRGNDSKSTYSKYTDIDNTLKSIGKKIWEGSALGCNKVSVMAEQFSVKNQDAEPKLHKSNTKSTIALPAQGGSEMCHFCDKRVYLMEKLSADGKSFHRGCFRCEYCSISLRIGNHMFDREKKGGRFYCTQHFGLSGTIKTKTEKKRMDLLNKENVLNAAMTVKVPGKVKEPVENAVGLDLLDRGRTPERIEFENLAEISDPEEAHSQMDEDEWTDRNFGVSTAEMGSSDDVSDVSDSDEDNEVFEEAVEQPLTTEGTLELAKNWTLRYSNPHATIGQSDTGSNEYEDSSDDYISEDDESGTATEDEEDIRARELRKREVWLKVPSRNSDTETGSETEIASSKDVSTEESAENSATEISTDSEFEHDEATPTQHEIPEITINDSYVRKTRGTYVEPKKVQVKSKMILSVNCNLKQDKEEKDTNEQFLKDDCVKHESSKEIICNIPSPVNMNACKPLLNPRKGDYLLNRTNSTGGIASRLSLELKRRYLLGGSALGGSVVKSGSTSNVDTKLRNFTDSISQHQKLLNPAPEPSPTMQAFLQGTKKLQNSNASLSPLSPTTLFSRHLTINYYQNSSDDITYKPTTLIGNSKMQQLPDLVKESSILKSKTAPNICDESLIKDKELIEDRIFLHRTNKTTKNNIENLESLQNMENVLSSNMEENNDFRSRSPLHETCIVVPHVDWNRKNEDKDISTGDSEIDSDSLSSDFNEMAENDNFIAINLLPPRLQIHSTDGDLVLDEQVEYKRYDPNDGQAFEPDSIEVSFVQDRRLLNRLDMDSSIGNVRTAEAMNNNMEQLNLQDNDEKSDCSSPISETSNKQDNSEENDITAAFTETEFSEWARDGEALVSDDLFDVELDPNFVTVRKKNVSSSAKEFSMPTYIAKKDETKLDCCKNDQNQFPQNNTSTLLTNDEDINYMDTDNELLLDDSLQDVSNITLLRNRGYVEFVNIKTINMSVPANTQHNLPVTNAPIVQLDLENDSNDEDEEEGFKDTNVIEIDPITMEDVMGKLNKSTKRPPIIKEIQMKIVEQCKEISNENREKEQLIEAFNKELLQSIEEDSLLTVEPAEDTTTSEAITVLASPIDNQMSIVAVTEMTTETERQKNTNKINCSNPDYLEYVNRLQSRIAEFGNTKDFIDAKKSKQKISKSMAQTRNTDVITKDVTCQEITITDDNNTSSPATLRKLEEITRERSKQKDVIQDLLMDKLEAHKQKSAEKKARRAARVLSATRISSSDKSISSNIPSVGTKFVPTSIMSPISSSFCTVYDETKKSSDSAIYSPSHQQCDQMEGEITKKINKSTTQPMDEKPITVSLEDIFDTSLASLRLRNEEQGKSATKNRQDAKNWNKIKSNEDLSLNPENKIKMNTNRRQLFTEDGKEDNTSRKEKIRPYSFSVMDNVKLKLQISKSTDNMKNLAKGVDLEKLPTSTKSMDESLNTAGISAFDNNSSVAKKDKKKPKDLERRKSIIQAVSDFFFKKESNSLSPQKDKISMFRLTSRSKGKCDKILSPTSDANSKSDCKDILAENICIDKPSQSSLNYSIATAQVSDDSLSEDDTKTTTLSCKQRVTVMEESCNSMSRKLKTNKKIARQAQLKRLRMAQEIQRKLEETEVKQKELESRGVSVEKSLRGEGDLPDREEADLLREWFDLMKERTELRRYEKELLIRAQEVQLEDRHERLQQELRERLADDDDKKSSNDVKKEGEILTEMLEIVTKRDSLIALLEEERQRYQDEERDLEAQMLAKGLRLTPIKKCGSKYSV